MSTPQNDHRRIIDGFVAGRKKEYETVRNWVSKVVKLNSWGLKEYSDDITQDVLLRLFDSFKENRFRFTASLKTYVCRVTKFTCIEYLRKHCSRSRKEIPLFDVISDDDPEKELRRKKERITLWRVYRLMSARCRELWKLVFWENLPYSQIAHRLGVKEGTVKSRFARCKDKAIWLRKKITEKEGFF